MDAEITALNAKAQECQKELGLVRQEMRKVIVGQDEVIDRLLIALVSGGHVLLEGVPGIAKTLTIRTLADCLDCTFARLQFTPDLLPADIMGTRIYNQKDGSFSTVKGPIFQHFVLADEINRAPPKVQSALLEAMQERQVTIQGETHILEKPFLVLATENPIESEGTYPLPEAQVDRFMFKVLMTYPTKEEEVMILDRFTEGTSATPESVLSSEKILWMQGILRSIYADSRVKRYSAAIVDATRNPESYGLEVGDYLSCGASPRATIYLILGAKAVALLDGRGYVMPEDVRVIAHDVLRHRLLLTYEGEAEGITPDRIIDAVLERVKVP